MNSDRHSTLTPEQWLRVKDLFAAAEPLAPADRSAFLAANAPDREVASIVARLLGDLERCTSFLEQPAAAVFDRTLDCPNQIGRYRILEPIGRGGMGIVYAAFDDQLNRKVALKVLRPGPSLMGSGSHRLLKEARAASALNHPNIVTIYEVGSDAGLDYIAMECISGATLAARINGCPLPAEEVLGYALQICDALLVAHEAGIVHRDLKPGNIIVAPGGVIKLVDFGLAKNDGERAAGDGARETSSMHGLPAGTVPYMSPEQIALGRLDARSDIFSFGVILYEALTGRKPFDEDSDIATLAAVLHTEPPPPTTWVRTIPSRLEAVVQRCLSKDAGDRYPNVASVRRDLETVYARRLHIPRLRAPRAVRWAAFACAAIALGFLLTRGGRQTGPDDARITQITAGPGLNGYPALSHDGKLIAFASDRGVQGNLDIWVRQINGVNPIRITSDEADDYEPSFSPDDSSIVFRSERDGGGVYVVPTFGGDARLIAARGRSPRYSPDGRLIAYWVGEAGSAFLPGSARVFIVPSTGGEPRQFRPDVLAAAYPVWSPRSAELAFLGRTSRGDNLNDIDWYIAAEGNGPVTRTGALTAFTKAGLMAPAGSYWIIPSDWQSRSVLFSARSADTTNIWAASLTRENTLDGTRRRLTFGTTFELQPAAAPALAHLAYAATNRSSGVWKFLQGELTRLLPEQTFVTSPSISANGTRLAVALQTSTRYQVAVADLVTGQLQIVFETERKFRPRPKLSGDGRTLAYWDGTHDFVIPATGGIAVKVCDACAPPTHVSFDGSMILFEALNQPYGIFLADRRSGTSRLAVVSSAHPDQPLANGRLSPDGAWIAFDSGSPGRTSRHIYIAALHPGRPADENEWQPLTYGNAIDQLPAWSLDGKQIYYVSTRDGFRCIWSQQVDPRTARPIGEPSSVTHFHHAALSLNGVSAYSGDLGLSATKNGVVFAAAEFSANIWLADPL